MFTVVAPPGESESDEVRPLGSGKREPAEFDPTDPALAVGSTDERLSREPLAGDVWQCRTGVDVDGVPPDGPVDGNVLALQHVCECPDLSDTVVEIAGVDGLPQADRHRGHVAPGHPTVGVEPLVEDSPFSEPPEQVVLVVADGDEPADVDQTVFLSADDDRVGGCELLANDRRYRRLLEPGFALADEPGVLGEPAAVDDQSGVELVGHRPGSADVLDGDWLARNRVVRERHDHGRHTVGTNGRGPLAGGLDVQIPLERPRGVGVERVHDRTVGRSTTRLGNVGTGRVEVGVGDDDVTLVDDSAVQQVLCSPTLVGGHDALEPEYVCDRLLQALEALAAGVGLVAAEERGPLVGAHRPRTAVGQQVDVHVGGGETEHVVAGRLERRDPLLTVG